jgi:F0F1-type ATP synthase membrane subunit b/b'
VAVNAAELNLNPLSQSQIDPLVMIAIVVIFIATYFALRRVFVFPYLAVMEERERLFEHSDETLDRADELERQAAENAENAVAQAAAAAEELRARAKESAEQYRRQRVEAATQEASVLLESGRAEIASARADQADKLRERALDCVGLACDRLLGQHDEETVEAAVDRLMARGMR